MLAEMKHRKSHPLEGSRQEAIPLPSTTFDSFPVVFRSAHSAPDWLVQTHPYFHCRGVGSHAPHQSPIRIKASGRRAVAPDVCPWHRGCPRKPSVPCRVQSCTAYRSHGSHTGPTFTGLTAEASHHSAIRRQVLCQRLRPGLIRWDGYQPTLPPASGLNPTADQRSAKSFRRLKGHQVSHHVITSACQLMGHGLPGQDRVVAALGQLALIKSLGCRLKAQGKLRRLHIGPRHIRVAIFDIARACALAIAKLVAIDTAAIRGIVPYTGKAADCTSLQRDRLGQYRANASHGEQLLVRWRVVHTRMDGLFQGFDLVLETVQYRQATGDCQHLGLLGQPALEFLLRQRVHPFAAEACPGMPRQDVLHTEDIGSVLTDHMGAFTYQIAHGPFSLGIEIPFWQYPQS